MPLYTYAPANVLRRFPCFDVHEPGEYELSDKDAAVINQRTEGVNGAPACVLVGPPKAKPGRKPKADAATDTPATESDAT